MHSNCYLLIIQLERTQNVNKPCRRSIIGANAAFQQRLIEWRFFSVNEQTAQNAQSARLIDVGDAASPQTICTQHYLNKYM